MRRRRSSLLDMSHVLLEAADATLSYLKGGFVSVLVTSAIALVLFELLGALIVALIQVATSGTVSVPDAMQLQLSVVTPISCGLVTLLTIINLLRLVAAASLRAARTAVTSARLHGVSDVTYDADFWPLPIGASSYYVVPTPIPSLPTQRLLPYRQARPEYFVQPWNTGMPWRYQTPATPQPQMYGRYGYDHGYDRYGRGMPSYLPPVEAMPYAAPVPAPYGYAYGTLYPVADQAYVA